MQRGFIHPQLRARHLWSSILHSSPEHRTERVWTSLICTSQDPHHALFLYDQMQEDASASPTTYTYVAILNACSSLRDASICQSIHAETTRKAVETDIFVGSCLVDVYGKCGLLSEACHVFEQLLIRDVFSWTALIGAHEELCLNENVLDCYWRMQQEGVHPDSAACLCSLKACAALGDLDTGQEIHAAIVKMGLEMQLYLGSTLVEMYSEWAFYAEAMIVLNQLLLTDAVAWNSLIMSYSQHGFDEEVLECFQQMQLKDVLPDLVTFVCGLKACSSLITLETGQDMHADLVKRALEGDIYTGSIIINMYCKCRLLEEAERVFDKLQVRNAVTWTALIGGYAEHGFAEKVIYCFNQMLVEGVLADASTFILVLKACGRLQVLDIGQKFHVMIRNSGLEGVYATDNMLISMYTKCGAPKEAQSLLQRLPAHEPALCRTLILAYADFGLYEKVTECVQQIQLETLCLDSEMICTSLKACTISGAVDTGQKIHSEVIKRGLELELSISNALVDMYAKCSSLVEVCHIFDRLPHKETTSWNIMIGHYAEKGASEQVLECFTQMQVHCICMGVVTFTSVLKVCASFGLLDTGQLIHSEVVKHGFEQEICVSSALVSMYGKCGFIVEAQQVFDCLLVHDAVVWSALITGYAEHACTEYVLQCLNLMQLQGGCLDSGMFVSTLKACGSIGAFEVGQEIHAQITWMAMEAEGDIGNALVDMYGKCGLLVEADCVFASLPFQNTISWTALLSGYIDNGLDNEVLNFYHQMQLEGLLADVTVFVLCLKACGRIGALESAQSMHAEILKSNLEKNLEVGNTLVDIYGKCGLVVQARAVFNLILTRDVISWNSMIRAYNCSMALHCFEEMQLQGVKPNSVTFTCLLSACSHSTSVEEGHLCFIKLIKDNNIEPAMEHHPCMVNLLARSGLVYEAERYIAGIRCPPLSKDLMVLLGACKIVGEVEMGQRCFQQLVELDQEDASAYLLMADIYAVASRLGNAVRMKEIRKYDKTTKKPGDALLQVDKTLHKFVVHANKTKDTAENLNTLSVQVENNRHILGLVLGNISDVQYKTSYFVTDHSFHVNEFPGLLAAN